MSTLISTGVLVRDGGEVINAAVVVVDESSAIDRITMSLLMLTQDFADDGKVLRTCLLLRFVSFR